MKIFTISGYAGSGKDTAAGLIQEFLNANGARVLITHNADLLKYICKTYFGWDGIKDEKGRTILQYIGTDIVRKKDPDFWVRFIVSVLTLFRDTWDYVLIPDCRFPNEIAVLKDSGFDVTTIRVHRDAIKSALTKEQQNHPSETALDGYQFDWHINNDGSLEDLRNRVCEFLESGYHFHQITFDELLD